jgi:serine acetyltransferase
MGWKFAWRAWRLVHRGSVSFDLESDVTIGANSVFLEPLPILDPTAIGAMTRVTDDIDDPGDYVGIPAVRPR